MLRVHAYNNNCKIMKLTNNSHDDKYWNFKCSEAGILKQTNAINIYLNAKFYVFSAQLEHYRR